MPVGPLRCHMHALREAWAKRRLRAAESAFFDAYGRGGSHAGTSLVIPIGWFDEPEVRRELHAWRAGGAAPDVTALESAWRARVPQGDACAFYRNLAHFLAIV